MISRRDALGFFAASLGSTLVTSLAASQGNTLLVTHPSGLEHDMGPGFPDRPERLGAIASALAEPRFAKLARAGAPRASREAILRVHTAAHLEKLEAAAPKDGFTNLGADVAMNSATFVAALHAAGGATFAVDAVMRGQAKNAFVATPARTSRLGSSAHGLLFLQQRRNSRPPRHRRAQRGARGYRRFRRASRQWRAGNFLERAECPLCLHTPNAALSRHGRGERGEHDNIVNAPLRKGDGGEAFRAALVDAILPRLDAFRPDVIILCAGFDAHIHDPLGGLRLVESDFRDATLRIMEIAARRCGSRAVSLLEGGYEPDDLARSVAAHVGALMEA